jgi:predicted lipoprotein with Yx(FWY)xxD motif
MRLKTTVRLSTVALGLALAVAACGSGSNGGGAKGTSANGSTISAHNVPGAGMTLTGKDGMTLYFSDQEASGKIQCTGACLSFWTPLTVSGGTAPTAGPGLSGTLATIKRPDGSMQVTYNGKPLYSFAEDGGPDDAKGNGFKDMFNGTNFEWHAATPSGDASSQTTSPGGGYGY